MSVNRLLMEFEPNQVVCFRLVNGDEILGKFTTDHHKMVSADTTLLGKVRLIMVSRTNDGIGISLMPWSFCNVDGFVAINNESIMAVLDPSSDMITSYVQQTTNILLQP